MKMQQFIKIECRKSTTHSVCAHTPLLQNLNPEHLLNSLAQNTSYNQM